MALHERLSDLLIDLNESLEVEVKSWLDLSNEADKATLAKAVIALANHGGGYVVFGHDDCAGGAAPCASRPASLDGFNQDAVNAIVTSYADPPVHCSVHHVSGPDGLTYPVVAVPGGHRVPIRARRAGPNQQTVQLHAIYIRRPGPKSEQPQSGREWDELITRCLAARRDELLDLIRMILTPGEQQGAPRETARPDTLKQWHRDCYGRWQHLVASLEPADGRACSFGRYTLAFEVPGLVPPPSLADLLLTIRKSKAALTGWSPFWVPSPVDLEPYPIDGLIECWMGREGPADAAHSDFWRISPTGNGFILRGFEEDTGLALKSPSHPLPPGRFFDIALPMWRIGEMMLFAANFGLRSGCSAESPVHFQANYYGLAGRELTSIERSVMVLPKQIAHQDAIETRLETTLGAVAPTLPELLQSLLRPLYGLFSFAEVPVETYRSQISSMTSRRYA